MNMLVLTKTDLNQQWDEDSGGWRKRCGAVQAGVLGDDGETATYSEKEGPIPW
ncbi:hypothetical protein B0H17DRAFT_1084933 [Mycena rosella]|uniref:Uncharacterized protein n=1 Tax=Mycena rosella TaxID=1033263 RepID=A0AAD7CZN3_MYCRO|nr:hypothetical protein B0H17DRAFT_1084933 [Mycena rosella]